MNLRINNKPVIAFVCTVICFSFCQCFSDKDSPSAVYSFSTTIKNGDVDSLPPELPFSTTIKTLYIADGISKSNIGAYSHHPHIIFHSGLMYATWSNHLRDEDGPGQRILMRISKDLGETWLPDLKLMPIILFPSLDRWMYRDEEITENNRAGTSNGFAVIRNGQELYAINEVLPCASMQDKGNGRLTRRIYDNGTLGEIFWLETKAPSTPKGFPVYPDLSNPEFTKTGTEILEYLGNKTRAHLPTWDFKGPRNTSTEIEPGNSGSPGDGHSLCEPTTSFRTKDGLLAMFWRDLGIRNTKIKSHRLYLSYSSDEGKNWSIPETTTFPDACSRPCAGNLPDGTAFLINNPGGFHNGENSRKLLALSLASDGKNFNNIFTIKVASDTLRFKGQAKHSYQAAYPHAQVVKDYFFIIYSINKEDIEICRIFLPDVQRR